MWKKNSRQIRLLERFLLFPAILFLLLFITHPLISQTITSQEPGIDFYQEMLKEISSQNQRISRLTIVLGLIVVFACTIIILLERKHSKEIKKSFELHERQLQKDLKNKMDRDLRIQEQEQEEQFASYKRLLSGKSDLAIESVDERILKAEIVKNSIWTLISPQIIRAYAKEDWQEYLKGWNNYHKLNQALGQVMSEETEEIWTGLGVFLNMQTEGLVPHFLWELVLLLRKHDQPTDKNDQNRPHKMSFAMGGRLDEAPLGKDSNN